jgi:hypothetical protein
MLSLMLGPRFKSFLLLSSFIGHEQWSTIVEEYDTKSLYFILLKCHHHSHPLAKFERLSINICIIYGPQTNSFTFHLSIHVAIYVWHAWKLFKKTFTHTISNNFAWNM